MNSTFLRSHGLTLLWLFIPLLASVDVDAMYAATCQKADGLVANNITEHSATLSWNTSPSHMMYEVEVRSKGRTPKFQWQSETASTNLVIDGLVAGSKYRYRVKATCLDGGSSGSTSWHVFETAGMSPSESCPKAKDLDVIDVTHNMAVLNWQPGEYAAHYEVEVRSKGRTPVYFFERSQLDNTATITGLALGGHYQFRVKAACENGASSGSTVWKSFRTKSDTVVTSICPEPFDLMVDSITASSAMLSWGGDSIVQSFGVIVGGNDSITADTMYVMDTMQFLENLLPATQYMAWVFSICDDGKSPLSSVSFETLPDSVVMDSCPSVANIIVDMITDSSAHVTWDTTMAATAYDIQLLQMADSIVSHQDSFETVDATLVLLGLLPETSYSVVVTARCGDGSSAPLEAPFTTAPMTQADSCTMPSGLQAILLDTVFELSWTSQGIPSYHLEIRLKDSTALSADTAVIDTSYLYKHPLDDQQYEFRVQSVCDSVSSSVFTEWHPFPDNTSDSVVVCDAPSDFSVDTVGDDYANFSWTGSDTVSYQIQVQTADTLWGFILESDSTMTSLVLTDLDKMTDFQVRVRSLCGNENSPYTEWLDFTTTLDSAACEAPKDLSADMINDSTAMLSWSGPDSSEFTVEVKSTDTTSMISLDLLSSAEFVNVAGLTAGVEYAFRVRTVCDSGDTSGYSEWHTFVLMDTSGMACQMPDSLMVDSIGTHAVLVSWQSLDSAQYAYMVTSLDTMMAYEMMDTTAHLGALITDLDASTAYQIRVKTICANEESEFSDWVEFTTLDTSQKECNAPDSLWLDSVTQTQAWVSWNGPDSSSFEIMAHPADSGSTQMISMMTDESSVLLTDLAPSTAYEIKVRTFCIEGDTSAFSPYTSFETLDSVVEVDTCHTPVPMIDDLTMETASMSWTTSSPNALYLLEVEQLGLTTPFNLITTSRDTTFLVEGLAPGGDYQWKITAFCAQSAYSECSPWMSFETIEDTMEVGCPAPTGLTVSDLNATGAMLSWEGSEDYIDFEVEVESLDTTSFYSQTSIVTDSSILVEGLDQGGIYQFKVNALCTSGEISEDSEWFEFGGMDTVVLDTAVISRSMAAAMVYPNPVVETMTIKVPETVEEGKTLITVTDLAGRIVIFEKLNAISKDDVIDFPVGHLREGVYQLLVTSPSRQYRQLVFKGDK